MKGKILAVEEHDGIILGNDEIRYKFNLSEWKEQTPPTRGMEVDFEANGENAKNIYSLEQNSPLTNKQEILAKAGLLGGLGIIGMFLSWIPLIGIILDIAGIVLLLIAVKKISDLDRSKKIFWYFLDGYILAPILFTIFGGILAAIILPHLNIHSETTLIILADLFIAAPAGIAMAIFLKKALIGMYEVTNEKLFLTSANTIYWGGLLLFLVIGSIILFIGWIILAIAFFSLRKQG